MDSIVVEGGKPLIGNIKISGSKNACLPIMAASILADAPIELSNVPKLSDVNTMKSLLKAHGALISTSELEDSFTLTIDPSTINNLTADYEIVRKMRASIWVLGPLLAKYGKAKVSLPGGCALGARQVDLHIESLRALGADIEIEAGYIIASLPAGLSSLQGADYSFSKKSVGATINAILAASLANGESNFYGCAVEPEIVDLCNCLNKMGAKISGIGTEHISITGIGTEHISIKGAKSLQGTSYRIIPDRIEAGTYMIAAAMTQGNLTIEGIDYSLLENLATKLIDAGATIEKSSNAAEESKIESSMYENAWIKVSADSRPKAVNISTAPYPGFSTDLQAQFMCLMTIAEGDSIIEENLFENRFMHVPELCRMGANITVDARKATVSGVSKLTGAEVMASDLRASVSLIIAALVAEGTSKIRRVYHLDRGYQDIENKLTKCGANIKRIVGDPV